MRDRATNVLLFSTSHRKRCAARSRDASFISIAMHHSASPSGDETSIEARRAALDDDERAIFFLMCRRLPRSAIRDAARDLFSLRVVAWRVCKAALAALPRPAAVDVRRKSQIKMATPLTTRPRRGRCEAMAAPASAQQGARSMVAHRRGARAARRASYACVARALRAARVGDAARSHDRRTLGRPWRCVRWREGCRARCDALRAVPEGCHRARSRRVVALAHRARKRRNC